MKTKIFLFSMIALTVLSCNTSKKANNNPANQEETNIAIIETSIENTKWTLTKLKGKDITDPGVNNEVIYFTLNSKTNRISGNSGCNTFMGTYKLEQGNNISFSQMASTKMMCSDAKINESQILDLFNTADNFTIINGELALNKAKMMPLATFKEYNTRDVDAVTEKYWKLKTLEGKEITMVKNQEREIYFMLKTDENRVTGFAGCNSISGEYLLEKGNRIRFKNMATTLMICPDVATNESELLKVFELADNYTITEDILSLNVGRRALLAVFEAVYMK
jgi:heat shock protein HslJ